MTKEHISFIEVYFDIVGVHTCIDVSARSATGSCQRKSVRAWSRRSYAAVVGAIDPPTMEAQWVATVREMVTIVMMERR
jgi:hypothetical protein